MVKKYPLISGFIKEFASEFGIEILIEPDFAYAGRITTKNGNYRYYRGTRFDINTSGSSEIAKDKAYASFFLKHFGYPVPHGDTFYSDRWCGIVKSNKNSEAASLYAEKIGYPVIVKPNSESQGRGVQKVYSKKELQNALETIFNEIKDNVALVQQVAPGYDYRIVVLQDEVLCTYRRIPLQITGDGKSTVLQLLQAKQKEFIERGRDTTIDINDPRIYRNLDHQHLQVHSILKNGQSIVLLANANLSSGGESEDVTMDVHDDFKKIALQVTKDMGLTFCGIDIMSKTVINQPMGKYVIIEINSAPGLDYYAESGDTQKNIVKKLYKKLFLYLINT